MAQHDMQKTVQPVKYLVCMNDSEHSRVALKFVCARMRKRNSVLDILHVLEPVDFSGIGAIADKIREEKRAEGQEFLSRMAEEVEKATGKKPALILREGAVEEQVVAAVGEDVNTHMLVLGASPDSNGRHMHITGLVKALGDKLLIPLLIVPGNLTDQQIEELA